MSDKTERSIDWKRDADWESDAEGQVRDVLGTFRAELRDRPSDEDLINTRNIDSLTFISVVYSLIERSGRDVDLESVASARLRTINGLAWVFFSPPDNGVLERVRL